MSHHNYASDREGSLKNICASVPTGGGGSDQIPTSLTDLAKWQR